LERYLRATQGTSVGVIARFSSFFGSALQAAGIVDSQEQLHEKRSSLEELMDLFLERQERVIRVICDRFADDLALVMVDEELALSTKLAIDAETFMAVFPRRMERLIAPARDHGKLLLIHTKGKLAPLLPILYDIGFNGIHPIEPESNDIFAIKEQWAGKLALVGDIPTPLLTLGSQDQIEKSVKEHCVQLAPGGGYVLGSAGSITAEIPPGNFVAMTRAVHRYGRYGSLGREM
jgi:uroporphyrinogen decarboxylase